MHNAATLLREQPATREDNPLSAENADEQLTSAAGSSPEFRDDSPRQVSQEMLIRNILVPTDFSPTSTRAVEHAVALANHYGAALTILHVIDINAQTGAGTAADLMKRLWDEGSTKVGELAWSLSGKVEAQTTLAEGLPCEVIIENSKKVDLLVLGKSRAKRGWKLFSRRTAQRVIENAACPVLVIRDQDQALLRALPDRPKRRPR